MREIKFRAWDKGRREYLSAGQVFISVEPGARPEKSIVYLDLIDRPDQYKERFEIEQYTGFCDEKGTEIYEGDIVTYLDMYSTDSGYAEAYCTGKVLWDNETLSFQVTERLSAESYEVLADCRVIGNIHRHPELLN